MGAHAARAMGPTFRGIVQPLGLVAALTVPIIPAQATAQATTRVSVASDGTQGSADGTSRLDRNRCEGKAACVSVCPTNVFVVAVLPTARMRPWSRG